MADGLPWTVTITRSWWCSEQLVEVRAILAADLLSEQHATGTQHASDFGCGQAPMAVQDQADRFVRQRQRPHLGGKEGDAQQLKAPASFRDVRWPAEVPPFSRGSHGSRDQLVVSRGNHSGRLETGMRQISRISASCSPSLLCGLAGNAEARADLGLGVATGAQALYPLRLRQHRVHHRC
jgi:hypothetical protein